MSIICSVHQVATDDAASGVSVGSLFAWRLPFDLSNKKGLASSYVTAGIALRVTDVLKPPHHDKVETPRKYNKKM